MYLHQSFDCKLFSRKHHEPITSAEMLLIEWYLDTGDVTESLEKLIEVTMSPLLAEAFDVESCLWVCKSAITTTQTASEILLIGQGSTKLASKFWESDILDEFSGEIDVIESAKGEVEVSACWST